MEKKSNAKRLVKFCTIIMFVMMLCTCIATVHADFWTDASNWYGNGPASDNIPGETEEIFTTLADMINLVGTSVIIIVTIVLGIKYMFGSVEAKGDVKESLITLLVACLFFFGWQALRNLLIPGNKFVFTQQPSYQEVIGSIFSTVVYVLQFLVVAAIIYVGVRYIFSGASGRADLKAKSGQFIIGIIMAFATTNFLAFISKVINDTLG